MVKAVLRDAGGPVVIEAITKRKTVDQRVQEGSLMVPVASFIFNVVDNRTDEIDVVEHERKQKPF